MAIRELSFNEAINSSLQVGDAIYYTAPPSSFLTKAPDAFGNTSPGPTGITEKPLPAGTVTEIDRPQGVVKYEMEHGTQPVENSFMLFSKPIQVNESGLKGYYADVTFENSSRTYVELFAISSEVVSSSK